MSRIFLFILVNPKLLLKKKFTKIKLPFLANIKKKRKTAVGAGQVEI